MLREPFELLNSS
jgi:hypothetical protein